MFERRLSIFPVYCDKETALLHANTVMGDYPMYYPGTFDDVDADYSAHLNLLSKGRLIAASSWISGHTATSANDDDIRTYWSAKSGNVGEWIKTDLGSICSVKAIQTNFYESNSTYNAGRRDTFSTKYKVESSLDGTNWTVISDRSNQTKDAPSDYIEFGEAQKVRYLKITNICIIQMIGSFAFTNGSTLSFLLLKSRKNERRHKKYIIFVPIVQTYS